jgi:hypothetical protein
MKRKEGTVYEDFVRKDVRDYWSILLIGGVIVILFLFGLTSIALNEEGIDPQPLIYLMISLVIVHILLGSIVRLKIGKGIYYRAYIGFTLLFMGISAFLFVFGAVKEIPLSFLLNFTIILPIMLIGGFSYLRWKWEKSYLPKWIKLKAWDHERGILDPVAARSGQMIGPAMIVGGGIGGLMGLIGMKLAQTLPSFSTAILLIVLGISISSVIVFISGMEFYLTYWLLSWEKKHHKKIYLKGFEPKDRKEKR